jgi:HK97 family phage prohead protease
MELKTFELKDVTTEERTFTGYAAAYGNEDSDGDIIELGAFADSIKAGRDKIKILWQHKSQEPIGIPVEMREDSNGLWVKGKISKTARGDEAMELMKDGVVSAMSVGFIINDADYDEKGRRRIKSGRLMEFSLVTFPANEKAVIQSVKEVNEREIERVLREAGVSRAMAKTIVSTGVKGLRDAEREAVEKDHLQDILTILKEY